ncbi:MAG TPA: hypothetical protein VE058_05220 [Steroidobacteraceae bacterium]|nr:hypothetical protein [Steroidobacteraceae bacterium]
MRPLTHLDRDIELEFIREFSVNGRFLGTNVDDRRERIRIAIWANKLERSPFRDSGMNYGQAYQRCYGKPIEMRANGRTEAQAS